jgi:hypothetical protein
MIAEVEVFPHVDDVELVVLVSATERVQDLHLHQCLMVESGKKQQILSPSILRNANLFFIHFVQNFKI